MRRSFAVSALLVSLLTVSCNKESTASGTSNIRLESAAEQDLYTNFPAGSNETKLYVDNADVYGQMLANLYANESNGIQNLTIENVKLSYLTVYSGWHFSTLEDHLTNCVLISQDYEGVNSVELAKFSSFNSAASSLTFTLNSTDLASHIQSQPDEMFFVFSFDGMLTSELTVTYDMIFDFSYSYNSPKKKK